MQTDITVLDRLMVVNLDVHIWSASRKLDPHDLGNTELPPEELASLGSKKVCNPEELNIFRTLKTRAESILRQTGVRFLCGWAIPDEKLVEIDNALAVIRDDFNNAKEDFLNSNPDESKKNHENGSQKQDNQNNDNQNSQKSTSTTQAIKSLKEVIDDPSALEKLNIGEKLGEMLSGISQNSGDKLSVAIPMPGRASAFSSDEIAETRKITNALRTRLQALLQASVLRRKYSWKL